MSSKSVLDKLHRLNDGFTTVSQYSHTGEGIEDRLAERDVIVIDCVEDFLLCINHIIDRIQQSDDNSHLLQVSRLDIESLKQKVTSNYPDYSEYVISFEYLNAFESSPTYDIIVRNAHSGEVLSMTHVALTAS